MHGYNLHQWATIVVSMIPLTSGIALLSVAFTKQEIAVCLAFPSTRSEMPALGMAKWQESLVSDICIRPAVLYLLCTCIPHSTDEDEVQGRLGLEIIHRNAKQKFRDSNTFLYLWHAMQDCSNQVFGQSISY